MAMKCAGCGSAQYMQAGLNCYHCVGCGAVTEMATGQLLPQIDAPPKVSNAGYLVRELSTSTAAPEPEPEEAPEPEPEEVAPVIPDDPEPEPVPEVIDLAQLSEEQAEAIHRIVGD